MTAPPRWSSRVCLKPPQAGTWTREFEAVWRPETGSLLNLGSGRDYRPGWTNMDRYAERADVRHDITQLPWPFEDGTFDRIWADQILEHLPPTLADGRDALLAVLGEMERVLKPGGKAMVGVPWPGSPVDHGNVTHYRTFQPYSFHFLEPESRSTLVAQGGLHLRLVHYHVIRFIRLGRWFNTSYHTRRWFGRYAQVGRKVGQVFVLEKPTGP